MDSQVDGQASVVSGAGAISSKAANYAGPLPKSRTSSRRSISFTKSRIMRTYAFATTSIKIDPAKTNGSQLITTPLSTIPVHQICFYLTPAEFSSLPNGSRITKVKCQVKPLGCKVAFDYGTTLTGTAATEFVAIGMSAIDLNTLHPSTSTVRFTTDAKKPMTPSGWTDEKSTEYLESFYGWSGCVMGIPRHLNLYYALIVDDVTKPGAFQLDRHLNRFLIHPNIGQVVLDYEYTPKWGQIGKQYYVPTNKFFMGVNDVDGEVPMLANLAKTTKIKVENSYLRGWTEHGTEQLVSGYSTYGSI